MTSNSLPLPVEALRWTCPPEALGFRSTESVTPPPLFPEAGRWRDALALAVALRRPGYHVFAAAERGVPALQATREHLAHARRQAPTPKDWCYVYNFQNPRMPNAIPLPAGRGAAFQAQLAQLVEDLKQALVSTFEGEAYQSRRQLIEEALKTRQEDSFRELEKDAHAEGIALLRTPQGFSFAPLAEGGVMTPAALAALPEAERSALVARMDGLKDKLQALLKTLPGWMKQSQGAMRKLNTRTATFAVSELIAGLQEEWADVREVPEHLEAMREDMINRAGDILSWLGSAQESKREGDNPLLRRYGANLLVSRHADAGAPVHFEENPSYERLLGQVEQRAEMGSLVTDLHLIRPGALHHANGGFLILDAAALLQKPLAYDGLKRVLKSGRLTLEPLAQHYGMPTTVSLEPEPIPLDVKVVLLGDRALYARLSALDGEFGEIFKVLADFEEELPREDGALPAYGAVLAGLAQQAGLRPFSAAAIAALCEVSTRLCSDAQKLSLRLDRLRDLLIEADYAAGAEAALVDEHAVQTALGAREHRLDRYRDRLNDQITDGTVRIETIGRAVGQMNGLAVLSVGDFAFGRPSRISAQVRLGAGEVIDIEREVQLGGPLHSKGVLILAAYLGARFGQDRPLPVSATLVFEQSYGGIDGDSASAAELVTLLSALGELPLRQDLAMTGSVDQQGRLQAIGGVNEKIEGFFDICAERGLTGTQGVVIPATNARHLMVAPRVVEAVAAGRFAIYALEDVAEALTLFTGAPAEDGFRAVDERLAAFAAAQRAHRRTGSEAGSAS